MNDTQINATGKPTARRTDVICQQCNFIGASITHTPGSIWIEIVLWLCFLIPGIIYSLWRRSSSRPACPLCRCQTLIPASSPRGQEIVQTAPPALHTLGNGIAWVVRAISRTLAKATRALFTRPKGPRGDAKRDLDLATLGSPSAQYSVGSRYLSGDGLDRDENQARLWLEKSASQGNPEAQSALQKLTHSESKP